jgi:hypothetical protein
MIDPIEHNPLAYFYMMQYEIWPAQHDSNVRPTPLEEFVATGICIYFNDLEA